MNFFFDNGCSLTYLLTKPCQLHCRTVFTAAIRASRWWKSIQRAILSAIRSKTSIWQRSWLQTATIWAISLCWPAPVRCWWTSVWITAIPRKWTVPNTSGNSRPRASTSTSTSTASSIETRWRWCRDSTSTTWHR